MLVTLLELANSWNWNEEKVEILWAIVKRAPREDWAWQSLLQMYNATGDTEAVLRVYSALLENNPNSHELRNNVASLMLLLNRDLEKAADLARQAYEADRTNAVVASTHAFALFRQGKATEGMRVMDTVPEASLRRPEIALYYAVLLNASGQREKAASFIALAEKARLLPEERQLLAAARGN
jgi:tetratricopeptide (TPR) repeat protein